MFQSFAKNGALRKTYGAPQLLHLGADMDRFSSLLQKDSTVRQQRLEALHRARKAANEWVSAGLRDLQNEAAQTRGAVSFETFENWQGVDDRDVVLRGRVYSDAYSRRSEFSVLVKWTKTHSDVVTVSAGSSAEDVRLDELHETDLTSEVLRAIEKELVRQRG